MFFLVSWKFWEMISENKGDESVDTGGEQVRTTFRNVAAPEQFEFDEEQWSGHPLSVILTAYREAYGQTVYQVAETLRIRAVYIQYLENGQYEDCLLYTSPSPRDA